MGSKQTTVNQTSSARLDPMTQEFKGLALEAAKDVAGMEYQSYGGQRVAGLTDLQNKVLGGYGALTLPSEYGVAGDVMTQLATRTPEQTAAQLGDYTKQYTQNVIDPTLALMERERAKAITGDEAALARAGAFGSRGDVYMGERQGEYEALMGKTLGDLQTQGYQSAVARMQAEDAARASAAGQLAGLGGQQLQNQQAILAAQMGAGEAKRQLEQQALDALYADFAAKQQFPLTQFSALATGTGQMPTATSTTGSSTQTERDPMGTLGKLLAAAGSTATGIPLA